MVSYLNLEKQSDPRPRRRSHPRVESLSIQTLTLFDIEMNRSKAAAAWPVWSGIAHCSSVIPSGATTQTPPIPLFQHQYVSFYRECDLNDDIGLTVFILNKTYLGEDVPFPLALIIPSS